MEPTWVLPAPDGPHTGPMNPAIREVMVEVTENVDVIIYPRFYLDKNPWQKSPDVYHCC